ncbi:peptidoglycan DD-metalloendopeptidase family protein [Hyphococcus sp.]|uniref:LysM peptidoglycan-binding domain-containing M23 family metallopeptidase n=1 Tax=Hyphococcus sp. TaxID=2038636 RepID=UPI003D1226CB
MNTVRAVLLMGSFLAAAACGSHNHAPVVYGSDPSRQTRVYHSPSEIKRERQTAQAAQAPVYRQPEFKAVPAGSIEPVQLQPVSAIYLNEPERAQRQTTRVAAATPPTHLHKAKGYIEVQRGDTVYAIARKFNVSPAAVIDENDLKKPYTLTVGQVLKLPSGAAALVADAPSSSTTLAQPSPTQRVVAKDQLYQVRSGDTLYGISRKTGVPVTTIASANNLRAPYALDVGQQVLIPQAPVASGRVASAAPQPAPKTETAPADVAEIARNASYTPPPAAASKSMFSWPVHGRIISEYGAGNLGRRNDGVNIAAPAGTAVRAAADGQVVYRGSELEGFGNLLLVKHGDGFVTAYAHNDAMLVKKGDQVRQGQVIAKVGQTGAVTTPQLHFEIRQESQAVNPVALLGEP